MHTHVYLLHREVSLVEEKGTRIIKEEIAKLQFERVHTCGLRD